MTDFASHDMIFLFIYCGDIFQLTICHAVNLLHMTICHMEKILRMTDFFSTSTACGACDKYEAWDPYYGSISWSFSTFCSEASFFKGFNIRHDELLITCQTVEWKKLINHLVRVESLPVNLNLLTLDSTINIRSSKSCSTEQKCDNYPNVSTSNHSQKVLW